MSIIVLLIVQCDDTDAEYEDICGYGATGCVGNATDPICQCDTDLQMVPASDGRSCVPGEKVLMFVCHLGVNGNFVISPKNVQRGSQTQENKALLIKHMT